MFLFNRNQSEQSQTAPRRKNRGCLVGVLIFIAAYVVFCGMIGKAMFSQSETKLQDQTVYKLEMKGTVMEQGQEDNPFAALMSDMPGMGANAQQVVGLDDLISNIRLAKTDDRVRGIVLKDGSFNIGMASAKTLRDELIDFKSSGKFLIAYAESYGEVNYYIASVADRIYLNPVGMVEWHGLASIKLYYPRLLEKIGVKMNVLKVGTFKSAVEPYFCTKMSDADKKQTMQFLNGAWNIMCEGVAQSRNLTVSQLNAYADELVELMPQEKYLQYGLVDSLIYSNDLDTIVRELTGTKDYKVVSTTAMSNVKRDEAKVDSHVAVLYAEGEITDETGEGIVGKKMLKTIRKIAENDKVKAVVLRVNSPGGSANASEQIWHAIQTLREKGLPVVVSMGDYAASGGYYISCGSDYIYAQPNTLTGSIGIFGLIPDFSRLRDKVGVDIDGVGTNKFSTSHMVLKGMTTEEHALMQSMIERGYDLFTRRCAEGRHTTQDSIKLIGEGRVWLGQDALTIGLVDEIGGLDDAIAKAAELAGIEHYTPIYYPARKDFFEQFMQALDNTSKEEKFLMHIKERCSQPRIMTLMPEQIIR